MYLRRALPILLLVGVGAGLGATYGKARFAWVVTGVLAGTVAFHFAAWRIKHMMLPMDRTALFIAVLVFLILCSLSSAPSRLRGVVITVVALHVLYFAVTLRLSYFREWSWNANVREAFDVVAWYSNHCQGSTFATSWMYVSGLNFYRQAHPAHNLTEFHAGDHLPLAGFASCV